MSIPKYAVVSTLIMAVLIGAAFLLRDSLLPAGSLWYVVGAIGLAGISGIAGYAVTYTGIDKRIRLFTAYVTGSMLLKMMIGIMTVMLIALKSKDFAAPFVVSYFFCYFIFTALEVYWLMRKLRPISKNGRRDTQHEEPNT
jgi:hypothetical protein